MKKFSALFILWLIFTATPYGQQAGNLAPMQGGENIAVAFVLAGPLPIISNGTTEGYLDDYDEECPYSGSTAPDVVYAYTPLSNVTVNIDLCGSSFDTKLFVYENAASPGNPYDCNDDYYFDLPCGLYVSKIENAILTFGNTYYIVIDGYSGAAYGDYILTISESNPSPCVWGVDVVCPPGAVAESEDCGDNSNGGCTMASGTENWETVPASGGAFCGTTWADLGDRDTDWYELVLTQASSIIITANSDQQIFYGLIETDIPGAPSCAEITGFISPGSYAGPCNETSVDLGVLAPGTWWFFVGMTVIEGFPCDNHYWIDFEVAPETCPPPVDLLAADITPGTADLTWTETGSATAWEYQYGPAGFIPAVSGTATAVNPTQITGLLANSSYDFYVRADCGGNYSDWSGPENFKTPCDPTASIPWSENFDAMGPVGNDILPACWLAASQTGSPWFSGNAASHNYNDPCSAPNYVYVNYYPYPSDKFLITPGFTLTAATSYDFRFNWTGDGYAGWNGDVMVNTNQTGTGALALGTPFVSSGTVTSSACNSVTRSFVPATSGTYYFMVRVSNNIVPYYLGFDDFVLELSPACQEPVALTATNITQNGVNLGWTPVGSETDWEYVIGESPLPQPAGPGIATNSNTVNPVTGLSENTEYEYYVRADCGSGFSSWAGPFGFTTLCDPVSLLPWNESFEAAWPPECWTDNETADYGWDRSINGSAHSGTEWAYCNLANSVLVTPEFNLSSDSWLLFWIKAEDINYPQDLLVKIGNDVIYQITGDTNPVYRIISLSLAAYTGQTVSISFTGETGSGGVDFGICLDDVSVKLIYNWTGNAGTAWNNPGSWSPGTVPGPDDMVVIPSVPAGGNFPQIDTGIIAECFTITLEPGAIITVKAGGTLNVKNP